MKEYLDQYSKSLMSRTLEVSRGGFNRWLKRDKSPQEQRRDLFTELVADSFEEFEGVYGAPRIADELNAQGHACSENYIAKIMSELGIRARNVSVRWTHLALRVGEKLRTVDIQHGSNSLIVLIQECEVNTICQQV